MGYTNAYPEHEPSRDAIDASRGPLVLEFGAPWCGHCQVAQAGIARALEAHPGVRHQKVEDGRGRPLGRSFRVKLWPTLVFLKDGQEMTRVVRPSKVEELRDALAKITDAVQA